MEGTVCRRETAVSLSQQPDTPICEFRLLYRNTGIVEQEQIATETSFYSCSLTGLHLLEQVRHNRHGMVSEIISLDSETICGLLPLLKEIVERNEA
jgi:hypothetical protein